MAAGTTKNRRLSWSLPEPLTPAPALVEAFGPVAATLLAQRGLTTLAAAQAFCDPKHYQPTAVWAFPEMRLAVERLLQAQARQESVWIWGDFDADGITATAVLYEGLGWLLPKLDFYIPNRFTESHGVSVAGVEALAAQGCDLIVTCDTGSTSLAALERAQALGIDVIITDHHTLPAERPPVVAMLNPRCFEADHPFATLSGVAVAYLLVQALLESTPIPEHQAEELLDLVAIGLIADVVDLRRDVRYLAQRGIQVLQHTQRPGVRQLLDNCKRTGDRAMDVAFGLAPRINAISRIQGDARWCVTFLTSRDRDTVLPLANEAELANTRRKELQKQVQQQVEAQLQHYDLDRNPVIVLAGETWPPGVLGPVAGQIAQSYGHPVILLSLDAEGRASGSARSVAGIDLYSLVASQADLLMGFGGHPLAAGLQLPTAHIDCFCDGINHTFRQHYHLPTPSLAIDLCLTASQLNRTTFDDLRQLEPYGMGNRYPHILVNGARLQGRYQKNLEDATGQKVNYLRTFFTLHDDTGQIEGVWWGHYSHELPQGSVDVVVELDFFTDSRRRWRPQVRLIDWQTSAAPVPIAPFNVVDARENLPEVLPPPTATWIRDCPTSWAELRQYLPADYLVLAYGPPAPPEATPIQLLGWLKALHLSGERADLNRWASTLDMPPSLLQRGLGCLGVPLHWHSDTEFSMAAVVWQPSQAALHEFMRLLNEYDYQRRYFATAPVAVIASTLATLTHE